MARFLVTGGAGFIGSALARRLIADGHRAVIADDLSTGLERNVPVEAEFIRSDLADPATFERLPGGAYDGVLHLAAQSSGALGQKDPYADLRSNVGSTVLLIKWCAEKNIRRFVYASSMTVYGQGNRKPVPEDSPVIPISFYGAAKLASENYLRIASEEGLRPTTLRLYNVYGPGQNLGNLYQGMASIYLAYLLDNVSIPVTGSFDRYRDFCYVDDVVEAFVRAVSMPETPCLAYNIGTGRKTTVRELLEQLISAMGLPKDYPAEELAGSKSDIFGSVANIELASRELEWSPATPLEEGLRRMVAWGKDEWRRKEIPS